MGRTIVIVGGGIAATTCLETLIQEFDPDQLHFTKIVLISASRLLTRVFNYTSRGRNLESFEVRDVGFDGVLGANVPHGLDISFVHGFVKLVDPAIKTVIARCDGYEQGGVNFIYDILVLCIGSSPKKLEFTCSSDGLVEQNVLTIRDGTSLEMLKQKLRSCRRVAIVGNGGISLGLVDKIRNCEKIWIVQDKHIGDPFLDSEAAKFLISSEHNTARGDSCPVSRSYQSSERTETSTLGPALGPHWLQQNDIEGAREDRGGDPLDVIYESRVRQICASSNRNSVLTLTLSNGRRIDCDLVISAIGVQPNLIQILGGSLNMSQNGGILIDEQMRTSIPGVYAAGDVVSCENWVSNSLWFQMRLWTQARQMGHYCGRCISSHLSKIDPSIYNNFDCFSHATNFFGKKVVLLGRYNLQGELLSDAKDTEVLVRSRPGLDYVKLVIKRDKIIGAILLGDSGLDETVENLIHDQIDIGSIKDNLLDDTVDIEDYFD